MSERIKTTLKILWIASGIIILTTLIVAGFLSFSATEAILQRKSTYFPEREFKWIIASAIAIVVWGFLRVGYEYIFEREKWQQRWRERRRLPRIYYIVFAGGWIALIAVRHFSSLSSPGTFLIGVLTLVMGIGFGRNRNQLNQPQWKSRLTVLFYVIMSASFFYMALGEVNEDLRTCVGRTYFQRTELKSFDCDILRTIRPRFTYTTSNPVPNTKVTCEGRECWKTENGVVVACGPNWNCMDDPNYNLFTRPNRPPILHGNPVVNCGTTTDPTTGVLTHSCVATTDSGKK
jgi:hypothetical protein